MGRRNFKQSSTGYRGVQPYGTKFRVKLYGKGRTRLVGIFDTAEEASAAYEKARQETSNVFIPLRIGAIAIVHLNAGKRAVVDAADWESVMSACKWQADERAHDAGWYARGYVNGKKIKLHCFLMGIVGVDHQNGDGLDNRRSNLRPATRSQNMRNKIASRRNASGFKGVGCERGRFRASIRIHGKSVNLGTFGTAEAAARAYDEAARKHFGEFACTNFPQGNERPARPQKESK